MAKSAILKTSLWIRQGILALVFAGAVLPASATIVLYATDDAYQMANSPHYLTRHRPSASSLAMVSASTSPQISHNLRRAHAWSRYDGQNGLGSEEAVIIDNPRPTSIEANMARARAYRSR